MNDRSLKLAGNALIWKSIQMVGVRLIFLLRLVILARLLSPDDFGLMAIAVTAIGFMLSLTDFGLIPALIQGEEVNERQYNVAWTVQLVRSSLVSLVVFAAAPLIAATFNDPRSADIIRVLALRPVLDGLASIKVAELNREMQFRSLAILGFSQALVNTVLAIVLAPTYGVWALVAGTLAGSLVYLVISYMVAPHWPRFAIEKGAAEPLLQFGRWIFLTSLVVMAGSYLLRVSIARQLGTADLGLYYLATQIAFLPTEVANEVIEPVAFTLFARLQSDLVKVSLAFRSVLSGMAALLFPACVLIITLAPALVHDVLGPQWAGTVPIIRILTLATMIDLFGEVTAPLFKGLGEPRRVTIVEAAQSLVLVAFILVFAGSFGLIGAAAAWLPAVLVARLISFAFVRQLLERPFAGLWSPALAIILAAAAGMLAAFSIDQVTQGLIGLILAAGTGVVAVGAVLWTLDKHFDLGFIRSLLLFFPQISTLPIFAQFNKETLNGVG
jgi:O-antigen/teichoic acid export membrane protein